MNIVHILKCHFKRIIYTLQIDNPRISCGSLGLPYYGRFKLASSRFTLGNVVGLVTSSIYDWRNTWSQNLGYGDSKNNNFCV